MPASDPILASVDLWPVSWAPQGWALCNGQLLPISSNQALFSLLGITFGGNGTTNFALPDLRGRAAISAGQGAGLGNYTLGQMSGTEQAVLNLNNLPNHTHGASGTVKPMASSGRPNQTSPENNFIAPISGQTMFSSTSNVAMGQSTVNVTVQATGSSLPFPIMQPYLVLNYIIALQGIYPMRD